MSTQCIYVFCVDLRTAISMLYQKQRLGSVVRASKVIYQAPIILPNATYESHTLVFHYTPEYV